MRWALLAVLFTCGCGVRDEGISVAVTVQVTPLDASFDTATLAIEQLELSPCQSVRWWQRLNPLSTAWAHGGSAETDSPLVLTAPTLLELSAREAATVGVLHPPPGTYCALQVQFAPSTVDAHSQGATLLLEGTWNGAPLRQLSTRKLRVGVPLHHQALDASSLRLDVALTLTMAAPAQTADDTLESILSTLQPVP